jgi:ABC-type dipeptide/oligopeptide/nickel transport system permease subunit
VTVTSDPTGTTDAVVTPAPARARSGLRGRRWRLDAVGTAGVALFSMFVVVAITAPWIAPFGPTERPGPPFARPDSTYLLGTDDVGKDLWSLLLWGSRTSLVIGLGTAVLAVGFGAVVGAVAGSRQGWTDVVLMRLVDVMLALPFLPLLIVASTFAGRGITTQIVLIAALTWARPARLIRSAVLEARSRGHVEVAEGMGATRTRLLWRHLSVGTAPLLIPLFLRAAMGAILLEASLAFLGLGDPTRASWGTTLFWANARSAFLTDAWRWWVLPPGLAISLLVVSLGLIGVAIERRINPALVVNS